MATRPDSTGIYPGFQGNAEFIFDETVSEGSAPNTGDGRGDLERLIILSPSDKVPRVGWERSRITVRPREGWRPNTFYRIELLPGVTDLRRNRDKGGQILTFTTGSPLPTDSLSGLVIDWSARQRARQVMVEAVLLPDSLVYRTQTDSSGLFTLAPMPHGAYLLRAYLDQNKNRRIDGRETWDSLSTAPAPTANGVLWLAERDTLPPRISTASYRDSMTVDIELSQPIDPGQLPDTTNIRIRHLPDSVLVPVTSLRTRTLDDTLVARAHAAADSARADSLRRAHPDTAKHVAPAAPKPAPQAPASPPSGGAGRTRAPAVDSILLRLLAGRPALNTRLVLRVGTPLLRDTKYAIEMTGIRNVNGTSGHVVGGLVVPKPPPPPKVKADSTHPAGARPDSTRADSTRADSTTPPGPPRTLPAGRP